MESAKTESKGFVVRTAVISVVGLLLMYAVALRTGAAFVLLGFSSDTCWLLKLGQIISQHGIPKSDPFTFTLPMAARAGEGPPFVVYQWLSELVFYLVHFNFHESGVLAFGAALTALAFIGLTLRACLRANAPAMWSFACVAFTSAVDNMRSMLRPEIFTCLFLATYLSLLQILRQRKHEGATSQSVGSRTASQSKESGSVSQSSGSHTFDSPAAGNSQSDGPPRTSDSATSSPSGNALNSDQTIDSGTSTQSSNSGTSLQSGDPGTPSQSGDSGTPSQSGDSGTPSQSGDSGTPSQSSDPGTSFRSNDSGSPSHSIDWKIIAGFAALMVPWCNFHSGFVLGLLVLLLYTVAFAIDDLLRKQPFSGVTKTAALSFVGSTLASLINPYGIGLWFYLPQLFFTPVNNIVQELQPIGTELLTDSLFYPLILEIVLCFGAIAIFVIHALKRDRDALRNPLNILSLLIVVSVNAACFSKKRLVSIAALLMLIETANLIGSSRHASGWHKFWRRGWSILLLEAPLCLLVIQGVSDLQKHFHILIPTAQKDFFPPYKALAFFNHFYSSGRVVSREQVADMMELYFPTRNNLFADSRFDAYTAKTVYEWQCILHARMNWKELLDKYRIDWIVALPTDDIGNALAGDPKWELLHGDDQARIFKRRQPFADQPASNFSTPVDGSTPSPPDQSTIIPVR